MLSKSYCGSVSGSCRTTFKVNHPNLDSAYSVVGWPGIAFRFTSYPKHWEPSIGWANDEDGNEFEVEIPEEGEFVEDPDSGRVIVRMVGDDRPYEVAVEDLTPLPDGEFCGCCGQIGCMWGAM